MYYSFRKIDSYNTPVRLILARRGIGKTFGILKKAFRLFRDTGKRLIYVVETDDMVYELCRNNGEKFFAGLLSELSKRKSGRDAALYEFLIGASTDNSSNAKSKDELTRICGGTLYIAGQTAGYIVSLNGFSKLKRNNFANVGIVFIDEFIPEEIDVRKLRLPYKMVSLVQSIARTQDVLVYMAANSIRLSDAILVKLGLQDIKPGEIRVIYDKYGPFITAEYVDNNAYSEFEAKANASVAGRFASAFSLDNLERNKFGDALTERETIPQKALPSKFLACFHGEAGSVRVHYVSDGSYYIFEDYGDNMRRRYCLQKQFASGVVMYSPDWADSLFALYQADKFKYQNAYVKFVFKDIIGVK